MLDSKPYRYFHIYNSRTDSWLSSGSKGTTWSENGDMSSYLYIDIKRNNFQLIRSLVKAGIILESELKDKSIWIVPSSRQFENLIELVMSSDDPDFVEAFTINSVMDLCN